MSEKLVNCPVCANSGFSLFLETRDYFLTGESFSIQQCDACGFKFVNPRPDENVIGRYYQSDEYISHDARRSSIFSHIYKLARIFSIRTKYKIVTEYLHSGRILDVGCGTGEFPAYCKKKGFEVAGVEPNEKARSFAQRVNKIPVTGKIPEIEAGPGAYHCITMWHVLEHLHDLNETLERVRGLLAPQGVFIVAVPNCKSWDAQKYDKYWAAYDVPRHLYHFTETTLNILVRNHGFEIIQTIPQKLDAYYVSMLSEKYLSGRNKYLKAMVYGLWSNFQAGRKGNGHSSQIFVLSLKMS